MKKWNSILVLVMIVSSIQLQANDVLKQCDINNNWHIDTRIDLKWKIWEDKVSWIKIIRDENKCKRKYELAQNEQRLAQNKQSLAQLDMTLEWLKKEIKKIEDELKQNKDELKETDDELKRKLKLLIETLKEIEPWAKSHKSQN